jgi:hypothetical protein
LYTSLVANKKIVNPKIAYHWKMNPDLC